MGSFLSKVLGCEGKPKPLKQPPSPSPPPAVPASKIAPSVSSAPAPAPAPAPVPAPTPAAAPAPLPSLEDQPLDIIIVGAGLGGLGAAISCAQDGGRRVRVRVLEQAKAISEVGAGLQVTPNGSRLVKHWQIDESFWAAAPEPSDLYVHRYSGEVLFHEAAYGPSMRRRYGAPFVDVHRADLQQALYARAQALGVEFVLGQRVVDLALDRADGRAQLTTAAGDTFAADLVVGADGLWSQCRAAVLGTTAQPRPTGDLAYRIVLTVDEIPDADLRDWVRNASVHFWVGPNSHAVGYSLKGGEMYNIVLLCPDTLPGTVSKETASVDEMRALFTPWDPILQRFLSFVSTVDKWKLMHLDELPHWVNKEGNLVFLGDACHPMLPYLAQGANSSLEDGAVLGTLLARLARREDLPATLRLYESVRKQRGEAIVRETFNQRNDFHMVDGEAADARNAVLRAGLQWDPPQPFPSRWNCPKVQPWLYGYDAVAAAEEALKSHQTKASL